MKEIERGKDEKKWLEVEFRSYKKMILFVCTRSNLWLFFANPKAQKIFCLCASISGKNCTIFKNK